MNRIKISMIKKSEGKRHSLNLNIKTFINRKFYKYKDRHLHFTLNKKK